MPTPELPRTLAAARHASREVTLDELATLLDSGAEIVVYHARSQHRPLGPVVFRGKAISFEIATRSGGRRSTRVDLGSAVVAAGDDLVRVPTPRGAR